MSYFYRSRVRWRRYRHAVLAILIGVAFTYFYCEYLIYFNVQSECDWPVLSAAGSGKQEPVRAMIIADTHLLGSRNGHWFDKMRREWQMQRAFQTAITLHRPELVFVLGDLFDEGLWCSDQEFDDYVKRFFRMFEVPDATQLYSIAGNHDIGFHYRMTGYLESRFGRGLSSPLVQLVSVRGNHFVLLNSMAMEGDGCSLCARAVTELERIANLLKCTSGSSVCKGKEKLSEYSRPILMQHFPLYRESDASCLEADAPLPDRRKLFEERWDCLSRESSELLTEALRPRAAFGGHTHHYCRKRHLLGSERYRLTFTEYSVPSFSWRNRINPEYMLATFSPAEYKVSRCRMPEEFTMKLSAAILLLMLLIYLKYVACGSVSLTRRTPYRP